MHDQAIVRLGMLVFGGSAKDSPAELCLGSKPANIMVDYIYAGHETAVKQVQLLTSRTQLICL